MDEQNILEDNGKLFKNKKRFESLKQAAMEGYKIAIFDDGLQDFSINYDLNIVCFNNINWIGNGLTIPSGPLRESINNIKKYKNVFLNGNNEDLEEIKKYIFKIDNKLLKYIAITSAYFPLTLISSHIYRDIVGIALMSIGLVLIFSSRKFIIQLLMLVIACYLFYLQRTIYPLILISAFIIDKMINQHSNSLKMDRLIKLFTIIITIIIFPIIFN